MNMGAPILKNISSLIQVSIEMSEKRATFVGLVRDHRTRIGRIKAVRGGPAGRKSEDKAE